MTRISAEEGETGRAGAAERFELRLTVRKEEIDQLGHVGNIVYLHWVQDAAIAHWRERAPQKDQDALLWVVVRHEIDYLRPAMPGDMITAVTWVGSASGLRFQRHTEIFRETDRKLLARALTHWCPIDRRTLRPTDVSEAVRRLFSAPSP